MRRSRVTFVSILHCHFASGYYFVYEFVFFIGDFIVKNMTSCNTVGRVPALCQCLLLLLLGLQCDLTKGQTCLSSTNDLESLEVLVTDYSVERRYILCPQTTYSIGLLDFYGTLQTATGADMIHLRPNLHIQCGDSGESANNCIISGGSLQVDGTAFRNNVTSLDNVVISGLTFTNTLQSNVWIDRQGSVLFRDCIFQVNLGWLSLYIDTD